MKLTEQQQAIRDEVLHGTGHLCAVARAGTGKTSTGEMALTAAHEAQPDLEIGGMAFNRDIADTLARKLPFGKVKTSNAFGYASLFRRIKAKLGKPDDAKRREIIRALRLGRDEFPDLYKAIGIAQMWCLVPSSAPAEPWRMFPDEQAEYRNLFNRYNIDVGHCPDPVNVLRDALHRCIMAAWKGQIDYNDQIYMSVVYRAPLPKFDLLMGDEAQDWVPAQREMARMMLRPGGRLIAFGDDRQAIYGFRGADRESLPKVIEEFDCKVLPLTISFRCSQAVVREAQKIVPDIEPWAEATEGEVSDAPKAISLSSMHSEKAAVLCRNNAPLISLCLKFIRQGIGAVILGREIGTQLKNLIWRTKARTVGQLNMMLSDYVGKQVALLEQRPNTENQIALLGDKRDCIYALMAMFRAEDSIDRITAQIDNMFKDKQGVVTLSTAHKAKGLEWNVVYILDPHLMPSPWAKKGEEILQEMNLKYVAVTRSQNRLHWLNSEDI